MYTPEWCPVDYLAARLSSPASNAADSSDLPGRYRVLAPKLSPLIRGLVKNKTASATVLKIGIHTCLSLLLLVSQRLELDARDHMISHIFAAETLSILLSDTNDCLLLYRILSSACIDSAERIQLAQLIRSSISVNGILSGVSARTIQSGGYKRLLDELSGIPASASLPDNGDKASAGELGNDASSSAIDLLIPTPLGFLE